MRSSIFIALLLAGPSAMAADDDTLSNDTTTAPKDETDRLLAEHYYRPRHPIVMLAPAFGGGGFNSSGVKGGGAGPSLRLDLEALHPLWFSATGRVFATGPVHQETLDLHLGLELRGYRKERLKDGTLDRDRFFVRPIAGAKLFRYADANDVTSKRALLMQLGVDWTFILRDKRWRSSIWRAHINGGISPKGDPGVEFETTWGIAVDPRALAGPFIGVNIGTFGPTGAYGGLEVGFAYEL